MIDEYNLNKAVIQLSDSDKKKVINSQKEYCVLYSNISNVGTPQKIRLTNDYARHRNVHKDGHLFIETEDVVEALLHQEGRSDTMDELDYGLDG